VRAKASAGRSLSGWRRRGHAEALDAFLDAAHGKLGRVDILVNNPSGLSFVDDAAAWQSTLNVDVMAAVRASWKVVPWMAGNGGGSIVHISSIAGLEARWASYRRTARPRRRW
jgi:3-oxoacyl-[acyl-carrier protein] reductase